MGSLECLVVIQWKASSSCQAVFFEYDSGGYGGETVEVCLFFYLFLSSLSMKTRKVLPFGGPSLPIRRQMRSLMQHLALRRGMLLVYSCSSPVPHLNVGRCG